MVDESLCAVATSDKLLLEFLVEASLTASNKSSPLWSEITVRDPFHSHFIDQIGDGQLLATRSTTTASELVKLDLMALAGDDDQAMNTIFPDVSDVYTCSK